METTVYLEFRILLDVLTVSYGSTPILQLNVYEQRRVQIGNLDNLPSVFPSSGHAYFSDFTLLFCRGLLRNELSFKTHVLSHCSAHNLDL